MHDAAPPPAPFPRTPAAEALSTAPASTALQPDQRFIAADVGGTHARLGVVRMTAAGHVAIDDFHQYACAGYPSLAAIVRDFIARTGVAAGHAVIAIAGRLDGDVLVNSNLPWPVALAQTQREAGVGQLALMNDFEAVACAMPFIEPAAMTRVCGPERAATGPAVVLGPGTGLGAAVRLPGPPAQVLSSEAGHAALAVGNAREMALLQQLLQRWPHVDSERVLSGPGLVNTYRALCELDGVPVLLDDPAQITAAAQAGRDARADEALQIFCGLLGSLAGDLALTFGASAIYLAGGIPAQIKPQLLQGVFAARFVNKGVLAPVVAQVPVWLVEHGQLGLIGAAAWYQQRERELHRHAAH
ncbi:MAG TPA: glucokinase [Stenotrophomonas sp.]|nr:glucokinase [Stenotrophomonas sp.]